MTNELINSVMGIKEAYQMPQELMRILSDEERRENVFEKFLCEEPDLSYDWFTDYYQSEHGDREKLKQDFTPDCICRLINGISGESDTVADICAGTGGLTIKAWTTNPGGYFRCEEIAGRAIPVLLFNMAIRGMTGEVINGDVLTGEAYAVYSLKRKGKYSSIEKVDAPARMKYDRVIMNPPYSLKWSGLCDRRFIRYGVPPKSKADYAFVLHGLELMKDTGKLLAVLPHGVLFRGQGEKNIREKLCEAGWMRTVIGLPDKLFLNTGIPVCIMELERTGDGTYFIDAAKEFKKCGARNDMEDSHIEKVLTAYRMRRDMDGFAHLADIRELAANEYNMNIPRYVDTYEPEELPDVSEIFRELQQIQKETEAAEREFLEMMKQLTGRDAEAERQIRQEEKLLQEYIENKNGSAAYELRGL